MRGVRSRSNSRSIFELKSTQSISLSVIYLSVNIEDVWALGVSSASTDGGTDGNGCRQTCWDGCAVRKNPSFASTFQQWLWSTLQKENQWSEVYLTSTFVIIIWCDCAAVCEVAMKSRDNTMKIRRSFCFRRRFWYRWGLCSVLQFTINLNPPFLVFTMPCQYGVPNRSKVFFPGF